MAFLLCCRAKTPVHFPQVSNRNLSSNVKLENLRVNAYNNYIQRKSEIKVIRMYEGTPTEEDYAKEEYYKNLYKHLMLLKSIDDYKLKLSNL